MNTTEVLKLALDDLIAEYYMENSSFARRVDDIFKEALVAPEDSSVVQSEEYKGAIEVSVIFHEGQRMFAVPKQPAQQEPVTWGVDWGQVGQIPCVSIIKRLPGGGIEVVAVEYAPYEYNPPAQRTWVGLTDEEIARVVSLAGFAPDWVEAHIAIQIVRVLEAKLKEKNT
jgi:hypothetical protein